MTPRKKSKPNPKAPAEGTTAPSPEAPTEASSSNTPTSTPGSSQILPNAPYAPLASKSTPNISTSNRSTTAATSSTQSLNKRPSRKWLGGTGSWRSKAPPVASIARESIGVAGGATSELPTEESKRAKEKEQSPTKLLSKRRSSKGDAIPASMTMLNVSSNGSMDQMSEPKPSDAPKGRPEPPPPKIDEPPLPPDPSKKEQSKEPISTFGWRSWWSRPDGYSDGAKTNVSDTKDAQTTPLPSGTPSEETDTKAKEMTKDASQTEQAPGQDTEMKEAQSNLDGQGGGTEMKDAPPQNTTTPSTAPTTSWFWLWSSTQNAQLNPEHKPTVGSNAKSENEEIARANTSPSDAQANATKTPLPIQDNKTDTNGSSKPSGWAFWFKDKPKGNNSSADGVPHKQVGEVAVFDTPSQSHPEAAQFNEQEEQSKDEPAKPAEEAPAKRSFLSLRGRPKAKSTPKDTDIQSSSKTATSSKTSPSHSPTRPDTAPAAQSAPKQAKPTKQEPPNILLPGFKSTYRMVQKPSYWQQIRQYFLGGEPAMPHLHINPAPPHIKKAIAIGVHGFFPAPMFQKILGQPTGTSVRFANMAATAIKKWTEERGYTPEIEQVALEGEGFIAERVNTLWKLLLNWIEQIKAADFILVACHSQGVPVAMMLVAKLIQFGCVTGARIGVCAMAGVNLGPFIEYKTRYFGPTAAELFEFSNPKSLVSQMYLAALDEVLRSGVRIVYVGSIDDQLVSLESSTFSNLSHPYIYRAVFVDGRLHAPDFLTHLVGFTLKLRNLGLPDHGLIRELSPAVAGSLYGGEGHSRLYEEPHVYELAVQHTLETTSLPIQPQQRPSTSASFKGINIPIPGAPTDAKDPYALKVKDYETVGSGNQNPYYLPWAMRGLLEEEFVRKELGREVEELLAMFESWKPIGKGLKDVKFRLEAVRSKL